MISVLYLMSVVSIVNWFLSEVCSVFLRVRLFRVPAKLFLWGKFGIFLTCSVSGFLKFLSYCEYIFGFFLYTPLLLFLYRPSTRVFVDSMFCQFFLGILSVYRIDRRIFF